MTQPARRAPSSAVQQWETALAAARRYLASPRYAQANPPTADLVECLKRCREHLVAVVEASRPQVPLARTVDETAAALGISPLTVYRLVNDGDLQAYRIGRRNIRIKESALDAFLAGRIVQPGEITGQDIPVRHLPSQWQ